VKIETRVLENRFVRLEPLAEAHKEDLRAACDADRELWTALYPYSMAGAHFDERWDVQIPKDRAAGTWVHYAVVVTGRCVGMTCFIGADPVNASVEIGGTYYRPEARGGASNPAAKRLMIAEAFDSGARRVVFRVDAINARSRAAVAKLGATQEGILRQDRVAWTGRIRDTVVFSILKDEWPDVRDRLDARLAQFA
jgi:RimJ/RimL family protein N-acetyltransferase